MYQAFISEITQQYNIKSFDIQTGHCGPKDACPAIFSADGKMWCVIATKRYTPSVHKAFQISSPHKIFWSLFWLNYTTTTEIATICSVSIFQIFWKVVVVPTYTTYYVVLYILLKFKLYYVTAHISFHIPASFWFSWVHLSSSALRRDNSSSHLLSSVRLLVSSNFASDNSLSATYKQ